MKLTFNKIKIPKLKSQLFSRIWISHRMTAIRAGFLSFIFSPRLSLKDQALFAKRLSLLTKAGVPILESLNILARQNTGAVKNMFQHMAKDVANGQFLSKSMSRHRRVFGDFAISIIRVGETSGTLSENLKYLSEEITKKKELRDKVIGALIYPVILLTAAVSLAALLTLYLFPKLMPIFQSLRVNLPASTKMLIWLSHFLSQYGFLIIVGLIAAFILLIIGLKFKSVRFLFDRIILKIPVLGDVLRHYHLANISRTLGLLLKGQVRVTEAATIAAETSTNLIYRNALEHLRTAITQGSNIAKHLEKHPALFPPMLSSMVAIGETTGNLSETLIFLAEIYEHELNEKTKRFATIIEPTMMVSMGLLVGFIAISIITPIYEVTQYLQPK